MNTSLLVPGDSFGDSFFSAPAPALGNLKPLLTVGILTFNSAKTLYRTLDSLKAQTLDPRYWKVICIDHGSSDETLEVLMQFTLVQKNCSLQSSHENNIASSRQRIIAAAATEWIAFLDSDVAIPETWLQDALSIARSSKLTVAGIGSALRLKPLSAKLKSISDFQDVFLGHIGAAQMFASAAPRSIDHLPMAAAIFKRHSILQVGGIHIPMKNCGEDLELGQRLTQNGFELLVDPRLNAHHLLSCQTRRDWWSRAFRFGRARIRVAFLHPHIWLGRQILVPLCVATVHAILLLSAVLTHNPRWFTLLIALLVAVLAIHAALVALTFTIALGLPAGLKASALALPTHLAYAYGELYEVVQAPVKALAGGINIKSRCVFRWPSQLKDLALRRARKNLSREQ
jgi:glycosyltransferase involved in cell wall biosynthesis